MLMNFFKRKRSRRSPVVTQEMRDLGTQWVRQRDEWREVCGTCGGNCGQCGMTERLGNIPVNLDEIAAAFRGE